MREPTSGRQHEALLQQRADRLHLRRFETWAATPGLLSEALKVAGIVWSPDAIWAGESVEGHYLYTWVAPHAPELSGELDVLRASAVLYIGKSTAADGNRLVREAGLSAKPNPSVGIAMAVSRHHGRAVYGPVSVAPDLQADLDVKDDSALRARAERITTWSLSKELVDNLIRFWREIKENDPVPSAEALAIRVAMHLGHIGAPVNSSGASAWYTEKSADWMAYAVRGQLDNWSSRPEATLTQRI